MTRMTVLRKDMRAQGMKYLLFHPLIFQRKILIEPLEVPYHCNHQQPGLHLEMVLIMMETA